VNARVDKSAAVARAGGVGMVLVNVTPGSQDADFHAVPTVHVDASEGRAIKDYVEDADEDATASIDPAAAEQTAVPQIAEFSSRGPSKAVVGNLLKPDIAAPGVGVVSAASPAGSGRLWDVYSGTSMSAPHIAGLAALVQGARPEWSPAAVKSAMMTTAYDVEGNNRPMAQGAGHVNPSRFLDPGLVYDATGRHWRAYLNGAVETSDVNVASIAVGDLTGRTVVKRRVTNVTGRTATFSADVTGLDGVRATVVPDTLLLAPGETA
jgi:subtilisin family serine protease